MDRGTDRQRDEMVQAVQQLLDKLASCHCRAAGCDGHAETLDDGTLFLNSRELDEVPEHIRHLPGMTSLDLSGNQLTSLPEWIGELTDLASLDVSCNQLTELP